MTNRSTARELAGDAVRRGKPLDWFEELYTQAAGDPVRIPWADLTANPHLMRWKERRFAGGGRSALVVGCGLGDDAEELDRLGFQVTAFDISPTCIEWCRARYPDSRVDYRTADLFQSPPEWRHQFEFVLEIYTLQVLPPEMRRPAMDCMSNWVAKAGTMLVVCRGREEEQPAGELPWPLTKSELNHISNGGLELRSFDDFWDDEDPPVRRFVAEYQRPSH